MKNIKRHAIRSAIVAGLLAIGMTTALAQTNLVGVNFVNYGGLGIDNTNPASLLPSESAGAPGYAQVNWNNLAKSGDGFTNGVVLTNSLGAATTLFINWDGGWTDSSGTATSLGSPDGKLMDGSLASSTTANTVGTSVYGSAWNEKPLVYVSGLQSWYQAQGAEAFGVVVYRNAHNWWDTSVAWIQSVTGSPTNNTMAGGADLTPRLWNSQNTIFAGTYVQIPATATNQANEYYGGGNYCTFIGITNDAVLIRTGDFTDSGWGNSPLNGFQIVPVFPTLPIVNTPTFSPSSTVYAEVPVTISVVATGDPLQPQLWYQWQSDNGNGGLATNNILDATNTTYSFTPTNSDSPYTLQFQVVVTNVFGATTSLVATLTVNPGVPPYVTTDTTPGAGNSSSAIYSYVNGSITFNAAFDGPHPIDYQWQADTGSGYVDILDATNTTVTLTNLQLSDSGSYQLFATNHYGGTPSTPSALTVLDDPAAPDVSQAYAYAVMTNNPYAYWRFSETIDSTAGNSVQAYDYSGHNFNATYGNQAYDMQAGPAPSAFPGFESTNTSVGLVNGTDNSWLNVPNLNLNTNAVTITAWINPSAGIGSYWGLFMWHGANGDVAGFGFGGNITNSVAELGYNWNSNSASTYNFHSGLYAPLDQWSFVALTITPTNSTLYLYYIDGGGTHLSKAVQSITNLPEAFSGGTIRIGTDNYSGRNFNGYLDEVAVFNQSLTESQLQNLFLTASGLSGVASYIATDITATPANAINLYPGQVPVKLTVVGSGAPAPNYQWQAGSGGVFTNIMDGGVFSGASSGTLTINPVAPANYLDYRLVLTNTYGSATSSVYALAQAVVPNNGLWTARYQFTNSSGTLWYNAYGSGTLSVPGILGSGNFWNPVPGTGDWNGGPFTSASDYMDDGSTHSGVTVTLNGSGQSIAAGNTNYPANDRRGLLTQFAFYSPGAGITVTNAIVLHVPNGIFNLALHGDDAPWSDRGAAFTVHGANGDQTDMTTNTSQYTYFVNHDSSVVITNVLVTNGVLNVDAAPTPSVPAHATNDQFVINAVEVQLVSYGTPTAGFNAAATNVYVGQWFAFSDQSSSVTNVVWDFGDGDIYTNVNGTVYHAYSAVGTYTVSQTVTGPGGTASVTKASYIHVFAQPGNGDSSMSSGSFIFSGTGGIPGDPYRILTSTNLALPLANWTPVLTNTFGMDGSYSYTNSSPTNGANFFIMVSP